MPRHTPIGGTNVADEMEDAPSQVKARATDYLSAAVERRAQGRAAIASGDDLGAVEVSRKSAYPRRARTVTMDFEPGEERPPLRPTKGPVTPVPKAELVPNPKISASQSSLLSRLAPPAEAQPDPADGPATRAPEPAAPGPAPALPVRTPRSFAAEAESDGPRTGSQPPVRAPDLEAGQDPPPAARPTTALAPWGRRTARTVEVPEPAERRHAPREFYVPEWDRYYNPGFLPKARVPEMRISRAHGPSPDDPAWMLVGRPRGMGHVATSRAPYRASLREGARVQSSRPRREVERYLEHRDAGGTATDLEGPAEVPEDAAPEPAGRREGGGEEFERALADLEESFRSAQPATVQVPARAVVRAAPNTLRAEASPEVEAAASRALPVAHSAMRPQRPVARRLGDEASEEDESEIAPGEEEEGTLGRRPPPDHVQEAAAHQALAHDATGASLCPTCGRRVTPSNPVLVCTSCGRVACASCGKFSAGEPTGNIYQYEYKFNFPLCQPCFERHFTVQKNLARGRAYLASGNLTYAFYHAQTALKADPESPYAGEARELLSNVEARRGQQQRADKEWEEARKKLMRERTSVLK